MLFNEKDYNTTALMLKENLSLQDALIIFVVYFVMINPENEKNDYKSILELAQSHPLFEETTKKTKKRIDKIVNNISSENVAEMIILAQKSITPELSETAFEWATRLALQKGKISEDSLSMLSYLKVKLKISDHSADKSIKKISDKIN
ncbi:MAG: hypothetical protein K9L30_14850 [Desulfobacterales bacterium]|nr:hypothetical protein [Desulfobacterales bacterium]